MVFSLTKCGCKQLLFILAMESRLKCSKMYIRFQLSTASTLKAPRNCQIDEADKIHPEISPDLLLVYYEKTFVFYTSIYFNLVPFLTCNLVAMATRAKVHDYVTVS